MEVKQNLNLCKLRGLHWCLIIDNWRVYQRWERTKAQMLEILLLLQISVARGGVSGDVVDIEMMVTKK